MTELDHGIPAKQAEPFSSPTSQLGEGPLWVENTDSLYWVDITGYRLNRLNTRGGQTETWTFGEPICAIARTMFYIDSSTRAIWAFDFDPVKSFVRNRRTVVRIPETMGVPDGMSIDTEDNLWAAHWGDGMIRRWNPRNGSHLDSVKIQDKFSTSCAFGGPSCQILFVTNAEADTPESDSQGRLHSIKLPQTGTPQWHSVKA